MIDWDEYKQADRAVVRYFKDDELVAKQVVNRPTQTKTVADAVEWANGEWVGDSRFIVYQEELGKFAFVVQEKPYMNGWCLVCTRAEFEAYVKEQEGEKWTHEYNDLKCRTLINEPDREGYIIIVNELNEYYCVDDSELKPIKPTISESEMMERIKYRAISIDDDDEFGAKVRAWLDEYDII